MNYFDYINFYKLKDTKGIFIRYLIVCRNYKLEQAINYANLIRKGERI